MVQRGSGQDLGYEPSRDRGPDPEDVARPCVSRHTIVAMTLVVLALFNICTSARFLVSYVRFATCADCGASRWFPLILWSTRDVLAAVFGFAQPLQILGPDPRTLWLMRAFVLVTIVAGDLTSALPRRARVRRLTYWLIVGGWMGLGIDAVVLIHRMMRHVVTPHEDNYAAMGALLVGQVSLEIVSTTVVVSLLVTRRPAWPGRSFIYATSAGVSLALLRFTLDALSKPAGSWNDVTLDALWRLRPDRSLLVAGGLGMMVARLQHRHTRVVAPIASGARCFRSDRSSFT